MDNAYPSDAIIGGPDTRSRKERTKGGLVKTRNRAFVAAVMFSLAGFATVATAQQSRPYGEEGYQAASLTSVNNPYSDYPAAEVQAVPAAKARAAIAKMELLRAQADLNRGTRAAVRTFEKSEHMSKATVE